MWRKIRAILAQTMLTTIASQCGGDDGAIFTPGGNDDGAVTISVTDAPVDFASAVVVQFTAVELTPDNGDTIRFDFSQPQNIDLLALSSGASSVLVQNQTVPAGNYSSISFFVNARRNVQDASFIDLTTGERFPLDIPDYDDDEGLRVDRAFTVQEDTRLDLVVDFDLRKSILPRSGVAQNFTFQPALRVVDASQAGSISGAVDENLVTNGVCTPFVYVFAGSNVVPVDMGPGTPAVTPLVSVPVKLNITSGTYTYRASFLDAGSYTVSLTCDGASDDPDVTEPLVFLRTVNITVTAGQTTVADFIT